MARDLKFLSSMLLAGAMALVSGCGGGSSDSGAASEVPNDAASDTTGSSSSSSSSSSSTSSSSTSSSSSSTSSSGSPLGAAKIYITPTQHSAGITITFADNKQVSSSLAELQRPSESYQALHTLTQYDGQNLATSALELQANTRYNLRYRVNYTDGSYDSGSEQFTTQAEFSLQSAVNTYNVSNNTEINNALSVAGPGDHIVLSAGSYSGIIVQSKQYSISQPLVIRAAEGATVTLSGDRTDYGVWLRESSHLVIKGLNITDFKTGIYINASHHITVIDNHVYDNDYTNIMVSKGHLAPDPENAGHNLILNNAIYSTAAIDCAGGSNAQCPGQTYFGFQQHYYPGSSTIIRGNQFKGHVDHISPCPEQDIISGLIDQDHLFKFTGSELNYNSHNIDIYDNDLEDSRDDHLELDGICSNLRVFNNRISGKGHNVITIAPALPGPYFIYNNRAKGNWSGGSLKMNTNVGKLTEPTRNIFVYHNNFVKQASTGGSESNMLNFWYDLPGEHQNKVDNVVIANNIFLTLTNEPLTSSFNGNNDHPVLNNNLWYSDLIAGFAWNNNKGYSFSQFKDLSGLESQGIFANPLFNADYWDIGPDSPAQSAAQILPGINSHLAEQPADIGAFK